MPPPDRRPNIVLINCDDLGYGDLGCYGSTRNDTPVLDRMADEGLRLTDFSMASPVCSPSRAALLTGCYPPRIGFGQFDGLPVLFPGQRFGIHDDEVTIASLLSGAGYATKHVGKWHCGDQPAFLPTRRRLRRLLRPPLQQRHGPAGADRGMAVDAEADGRPGHPLRRRIPPLPLLLDDEVLEAQPDQAALTARYVDESVRFMRADRDRPFFLYLAHMYVHVPIYVSARFADASRNGRYGAAVATHRLGHRRAAGRAAPARPRRGHRGDLHERQRLARRATRAAATCRCAGSRRPRGRAACGCRASSAGPAGCRRGRVSGALASSVDLFPTLAGLAGADLPTDRPIDGLDLTSVFLDGSPTSPREELWHYRSDDLEAVRTARWKLHLAKDGTATEELYDLVDDVGETVDRHADEPAVVAELQAIADRARADLGDARLGIEPAAAGARSARWPTRCPLTTFDPDHPYYMAEYDLPDRG